MNPFQKPLILYRPVQAVQWARSQTAFLRISLKSAFHPIIISIRGFPFSEFFKVICHLGEKWFDLWANGSVETSKLVSPSATSLQPQSCSSCKTISQPNQAEELSECDLRSSTPSFTEPATSFGRRLSGTFCSSFGLSW
jgi:hypothetical protein